MCDWKIGLSPSKKAKSLSIIYHFHFFPKIKIQFWMFVVWSLQTTFGISRTMLHCNTTQETPLSTPLIPASSTTVLTWERFQLFHASLRLISTFIIFLVLADGQLKADWLLREIIRVTLLITGTHTKTLELLWVVFKEDTVSNTWSDRRTLPSPLSPCYAVDNKASD